MTIKIFINSTELAKILNSSQRKTAKESFEIFFGTNTCYFSNVQSLLKYEQIRVILLNQPLTPPTVFEIIQSQHITSSILKLFHLK